MAQQLYANNATGYLSAAITSSATSLVLQSGQGALFPSPTGGDYFLVTLFDGTSVIEVCKCTTRSADTLTIVRAQEGTTGAAFAAGTICEIRVTKGTLEALTQNANAAITGGSITGITDLAVADGGTGSSTAAGARTNLSAVGYTTTTGSAALPVGDTAARDATPSAGYIRYNSQTSSFEGYSTAWGTLLASGGALGTPTSGTLTNCTFPTLNQNTTGTSGGIAVSGGWAVTPSGTTLYFAYNGVNKAKLDSSGNLTCIGNVTAYGTV